MAAAEEGAEDELDLLPLAAHDELDVVEQARRRTDASVKAADGSTCLRMIVLSGRVTRLGGNGTGICSGATGRVPKRPLRHH